jgi:hypothetical protein
MTFTDWRWQFYIEQHASEYGAQGALFPDFCWRPMPPRDTYEHYCDA